MKIAVIAPSFVPSNAANSIQVMKVCQALQQAGAEVALWVPLEEGQEKPNLVDWSLLKQFYGIETTFEIHWVVENLRFKRYDFALKSVLEAKRWGSAVIYTWMAQAAIIAKWLGLLPVLELHMMPSGKLGPLMLKSLVRGQGKKLFLPITMALKEKLKRVENISLPEEFTQIAPMGSEPERYLEMGTASELRQELGLIDTLTVAYTGHLYEGRGMNLLMALAIRFPRVPFLWIGGRDADVQLWRGKIQQARLDNVQLTGFVENALLPKYQAAADILLMPYGLQVGVSGQGDTADVCSPMKLFDYLSAGRVIISSDLPVIHEVLNEENAIFCEPDDVDSWENAIADCLENIFLRETLASNAKRDALRYSWLARAEKTIFKIKTILE